VIGYMDGKNWVLRIVGQNCSDIHIGVGQNCSDHPDIHTSTYIHMYGW